MTLKVTQGHQNCHYSTGHISCPFSDNVSMLHCFMAALCNRAGHIYFQPVLCSFFFFFFFPRLISAVADCMSTILAHTLCGLSANLRCRSETCRTGLAVNTGRKKVVRKSPSGHHRTILSGYIFATKARIDNRKKIC